jgi:hypothetical protein
MPVKPPSQEEIERVTKVAIEFGSVNAAAKALKMPEATLTRWIKHIGPRVYGLDVPKFERQAPKGRRYLDVTDGVIYVGSDAHYWPGPPSTAHRAFVRFIKREKHLAAVVLNGDAYDFPNISRFDSDWFKTPDIQDELEVVEERLGEIVKASGKATRYFTRGNHDVRYDRYLAKNAPEMRGVSGMCIEDRNPLWVPAWSVWVNDSDPANSAVIKHRFRGGVHATYNNTLHSGRTTVTGHLHALQCRPHTDYNGTRWGVDCGCLADTFGPQFSYLEDNPRSWRAGFVRLTWTNGRLLTPELIRVVEDGVVEFRGELIEV